MAKNNLAGLAALGALGMMMSKGSKGKESADRDTDTGVDVMPSYATRDPLEAANSSQDAMDIRDSLTRGAPGTSETVTPSSKPTASRARATAPSSRSTISVDDEAGMSRGMRNRAGAGRGVTIPTLPQVDSTTEEGMRNYVSRAPSKMKNGGVVKMAKGGMTSSASSRADGIASKGKTRGKIC